MIMWRVAQSIEHAVTAIRTNRCNRDPDQELSTPRQHPENPF